jgi:hypothetical protein
VPAASAIVAAVEAGLRVLHIPYEFGRVASSPSFTAGVAVLPLGFDFKADGLLETLLQTCGPIASLEMDTYPLLWMSLKATGQEIWSGSVSVVGSNMKGEIWPDEKTAKRVIEIGKVMLSQLAAFHNAR